MLENKDQLLKDILLVIIICIVGTVFVFEMCKSSTLEIRNINLKHKMSVDSLKRDSLQTKIFHDSLAHVDSLRVLHVHILENQDYENKNQRDQAIITIKYATDHELDSMWAVYSPKISN